MVFRRYYEFDFLHDGHSQQPYTFEKKTGFKFQSAGFLHQIPDSPKNPKIFIDICR